MHLTKYLLQDSSGVTFTVVIQPWPQTQEAHSTKDSDSMGGGRDGVGGRKGQCYYQVTQLNMRPC